MLQEAGTFLLLVVLTILEDILGDWNVLPLPFRGFLSDCWLTWPQLSVFAGIADVSGTRLSPDSLDWRGQS